MKNSLIAFAIASGLTLSGCVGSMINPGSRSNVSVFHTLDQVPASATFTIVGWREELDNSLAFRSYARELGEIMREEGLRVVAPGQPADYIAYLDYGIDDGTPFNYTYYRPQWGEVYANQKTSSTVTSTPTSQRTTTTTSGSNPTLGVTGYVPEQRRGKNYQRYVNIDIVPARDGREAVPVMEMRLKSDGWCGDLATMMPRFMKAIEKRFDDPSGKTGRLTTGGGGKC
ncbi:MAG: hypothetical protein ABJ239_04500 [Erythrobacter sp.]